MPSYFNLTLDTLGPSGVTLAINSGDNYTTNRLVNLAIATSDASTTGYQMKIWGIDSVDAEANAEWETFSTTKQVTLPTGDGSKTVYIKLRDNVYNESSIVSDSITLNTAVPAVTISGPDVSIISKKAGKNEAQFTFTSDSAFTEYKVKVVPSSNSTEEAGTLIGTTNGSTNMSGSSGEASTPISCKINGSDLETADSGDGSKIIKVFVKNSAGTWSM